MSTKKLRKYVFNHKKDSLALEEYLGRNEVTEEIIESGLSEAGLPPMANIRLTSDELDEYRNQINEYDFADPKAKSSALRAIDTISKHKGNLLTATAEIISKEIPEFLENVIPKFLRDKKQNKGLQ